MTLTFNYFGLVYIVAFLVIILSLWKIKSKKIKVFIILSVLLASFFNPFKTEIEVNMTDRDYNFNEEVLQERVYVDSVGFEEKQNKEYNKLKTESNEAINE